MCSFVQANMMKLTYVCPIQLELFCLFVFLTFCVFVFSTISEKDYGSSLRAGRGIYCPLVGRWATGILVKTPKEKKLRKPWKNTEKRSKNTVCPPAEFCSGTNQIIQTKVNFQNVR